MSAIPNSSIIGWEMSRSSSFGVSVSAGVCGQSPRHPSPVPHGTRGSSLMWTFPHLIFAPGWWSPWRRLHASPAGPVLRMAPWHHVCHPEGMWLLRSGLFSERLEALEQGVRTVAPEPAVWVPDWGGHWLLASVFSVNRKMQIINIMCLTELVARGFGKLISE